MTTSLLDRLHGEYRNAIENMRAVVDAADAEKRDMTGEETAAFDKAAEAMNGLQARIDQVIKANEAITQGDAMDKRMADLVARTTAPGAPTGSTVESDNDKIRALGRREIRELSFSGGTPEQRDQLVGTAAAGGNTVPTTFYGRLLEHMIESSAVLQANPTVIRTSGGEAIQIPKTTAYGTAALTAEAAAIAESDITFGQATLNAYKYARLLQVSRELIEDTAVDLLGLIARDMGRSVGNALGTHLITGTGTAQPQGIVTAATAGVTGGTGVGGAFTADNLIDLVYSVIAPYRSSPSAAFMMRDSTLATLMKLKGGDNAYLVNPMQTPGAPPSIWGYPIFTDPNVAAVAVNAVSVLFGDFSTYYVRLVNDIRLDRSDDFAFANDLVTFRCLVRGDGRLIDATGSIKKFTGAAT